MNIMTPQVADIHVAWSEIFYTDDDVLLKGIVWHVAKKIKCCHP